MKLIFITFLWTTHWSKFCTKICQIFRRNITKIAEKSATRQTQILPANQIKNNQIWQKNSTSGNTDFTTKLIISNIF